MRSIRKLLNAVADWIFVGKRLPILIVALILLITGVTVWVATSVNKQETEYVTMYLTVKGLGDDLDFEKRPVKIVDGDSLKQIFSLKEYPENYETFGRPFVQYNAFQSFLGVKAGEKTFHVTINGLHDNNLDQAYVYGGQEVIISYY